MKIIITGATGFIGREVVQQCLTNSAVTSIVCISRRDLPESVKSNSKVKVIILKDWSSFSEDVMDELTGAEACVWCVSLSTLSHDRDQKLTGSSGLWGH